MKCLDAAQVVVIEEETVIRNKHNVENDIGGIVKQTGGE